MKRLNRDPVKFDVFSAFGYFAARCKSASAIATSLPSPVAWTSTEPHAVQPSDGGVAMTARRGALAPTRLSAPRNPDDLKTIDAALARLGAAAKKYTDEKSTLVLTALCLKVDAMLRHEQPMSEVVAYVDKIIGNVAAGTSYLGDLPK